MGMRASGWAAWVLSLSWTMAVLAEEPKNQEFVVHEWGTFTCFSGSDGVILPFSPDSSDLPDFVRKTTQNDVDGWGPGGYAVSLETPVLYFYSPQERTVSVEAHFKGGLITAVYPPATGKVNQRVAWEKFRVLPHAKAQGPREIPESRYYAARETDAAPVQVEVEGKKLSEKFLFYRGGGFPNLPVGLTAQQGGKFKVRNSGNEAIRSYFLVTIQGKQVRFAAGSSPLEVAKELSLTVPAQDSSVEKLGEAMVHALVAEGLYEKEARAMVKTWSTAWFGEEGTRLLYLLPGAQTEELLPLKVEPRPDRLVRVMVGRHDILAPEQERDLDEIAGKLQKYQAEYRRWSKALGRFSWPAYQQAEQRLARGQ